MRSPPPTNTKGSNLPFCNEVKTISAAVLANVRKDMKVEVARLIDLRVLTAAVVENHANVSD